MLSSTFVEKLQDGLPEKVSESFILALQSNGRRKGVVLDFVQSLQEKEIDWNASNLPSTLNDALHLYKHKLAKAKALVTASSDFGVIRNLFISLKRNGLIPHRTIIPENFSSKLVSASPRSTNHLICSTIPTDISVIEASEQNYFDSLGGELKANLKTLVSYCQKVILEAYKNYCQLDYLIASSDIERIEEHGEHLDPELVSSAGQKISFFSKDHKNGLANCVAYLDRYKDRKFSRKSFKGSHHFYSYGIENILSYFSLSAKVITAIIVVVIEEVGINFDSFRKQKVLRTNKKEFVKIKPCGGLTISTIKKRAKKRQVRDIDATFLNKVPFPNDVEFSDVTAEFAIKYALQVNQYFIEKTGKNFLFLTNDGRHTDAVRLVSETAIKGKMEELSNEACPKLGLLNPSMKGVRVSKGVLIWLESDGDAMKSARYMGNTISTALRNYIPKELQELQHRKRIRKFQSVLSLLVPADSKMPHENMRMEKREYIQWLKDIFADKDLEGLVVEGLLSSVENKAGQIVFRADVQSISRIILAAKSHNNETVRKKCTDIIRAIEAEGSRKMVRDLKRAYGQLDVHLS